MTKKIGVNVGVIIVIGFFMLLPAKVNAELAAFSVKPIFTENQLDKKKAFFDLRVVPGTDEVIEVEVENGSDKEQTIVAEVAPARSNQNGIIDYKKRDEAVDKSMKINLASITKMEREIRVPANSKQTIPITLRIPEESFKGIVLGGLTFRLKEEKSTAANGQLENKIAYSIAVRLSEKDEVIPPHLELGNVEVTQSNLRNVIISSLRNVTPVVVEDLEIKALIFKKNQTIPLYDKSVSGYRMAPNSFIPLEITTNDKPLKAGVYTLKMDVKGEADTWSWQKEFTIKAEKAKELNKTAIDLEEAELPLYVVALIGGLGVLVIVILVLVVLYYRKNKQLEKATQKKAKQSSKKGR